MCFSDEASRQGNGVCMKHVPFIDLIILAINIYFAVVNRGTVWGWISTAIVLFYVWIMLKAIRET